MRRRITPFVLALTLALAACTGGGGSGGSGSTPTPAPPPPAPPPPTSPSPFNTLEFQANWGLNAINALSAYDAGLSGAGFIIAVLDTGVDEQQTDLDDNIHTASKDIYDGAVNTLSTMGGATTNFSETRTTGVSLDDIDGHGTFIAGLIAAEKNDIGMHGLAFDAQVLAIRVDESDSCPADCTFDDNALAAGINYAVANGADIISLSLGGSPANSFLEGAMADAVVANTIFVISAGNAPQDNAPYSPDANADPLALEALNPWANGQIIIAGSSNTLNQISAFSNRAGTGAAFYLLAPGEDLYSTTVNPTTGGTTRGIGSGTSFAAPLIAAAAALLMENFPTLTAAEVVDILLTSATDIGAFGTDVITGHGILNLEAALAPLGTTSLVIKTTSGAILVDANDSGLLPGGAFGDGFGGGFAGGAVFLDSYDRAYSTRFDNQIRVSPSTIDFAGRFATARDYEVASLALGEGATLTFASTYDDGFSLYEEDVLGLGRGEEQALSDVKFEFASQINEATRMSFGFGGSLDQMVGAGQSTDFGFGAQVFLADGARSAFTSDGRDGRRIGLEHRRTSGLIYSFGFAEDTIEVPAAHGLQDMGEKATRTTLVSRLAQGSSASGWDVTVGHRREEGMVLDSFGSGVLDLGSGADTTFVTLGGYKRLGQLFGSAVGGFGRVSAGLSDVSELPGGVFRRFETLRTGQYAFGISMDGVLAQTGQLNLIVSQPLRLESGRVRLGTASGYDYGREQAVFASDLATLRPSGRELDVELGYRFGLGGAAHVSANLLYQHQPGHVARADDRLSLMLTGRSAF